MIPLPGLETRYFQAPGIAGALASQCRYEAARWPDATVAREAAPLPQRRVRLKTPCLRSPTRGKASRSPSSRPGSGSADHGLNDYQASRSK